LEVFIEEKCKYENSIYKTNIIGIAISFRDNKSNTEIIRKIYLYLLSFHANELNFIEKSFISLTNSKLVITVIANKT
jgi:hypothetical protein